MSYTAKLFLFTTAIAQYTVREKTDGGRKLHFGSSVHTPVVFRLIRAKSPNNLPGKDD